MVASKGKVKRNAAAAEAARAESGKKKKKAVGKTKPEKVAEDAELGDEGVDAQVAMEVDVPAAAKGAGKAKKGRKGKSVDALAAGADKVPVAGGVAAEKAAEVSAAEATRTKAARREKTDEEQSVVYVGHLPPGFEERALRSFFEQFGTVKAVVLGRSQRTGHSQHFGFVEFERADVAHIAAAAMNGYYMEGRRLEVAMADGSVGDLQERLPARPVVTRGRKIVERRDTRPWHAPSRHSEVINKALRARVDATKTEKGRAQLARRISRDQARRAAKLARAGIKGYTIPEPKQVVS